MLRRAKVDSIQWYHDYKVFDLLASEVAVRIVKCYGICKN